MHLHQDVPQRPVDKAALVRRRLVDVKRRASFRKPKGKEEKALDDKDAESCIPSFVMHFIDISWCFNENGVSFWCGEHVKA